MGSRARKGAKGAQVRKIAKHSAVWFSDWFAGKLIGASLTVLLVSLGIGYMADDDRIEEATIMAAKQAGSADLARGYREFETALKNAKRSAIEKVPESWREPIERWSLVVAGGTLAVGAALLLVRAPSRAHMWKEVGKGIAAPGILGALATIVLEWRAMKGLRATLEGKRTAKVLWREGSEAAVEGIRCLWPALLVGTILLLAGILVERHHRRFHKDSRFVPEHVASHFLIVGGVVPWVHYAIAIVLDAFTEGSSTGASMAPFVEGPWVYAACVSLFSFGASLYVLARAEVKRIEGAAS